MDNNRNLLPLIDHLYESAIRPEQWQGAMGELARLLDASAAALFVHSSQTERILSADHGLSEESKRVYREHYATNDLFYDRARSRGLVNSGWTATGEELISDAELFPTEYFNDFLLRFDTVRHCFAVMRYGSTTANISLMRPNGREPFGQAEIEILRTALPHVERALRIHTLFQDCAVYHSSLEAAMNRLGQGIIFLDRKLRVVTMNEAANTFLRSGDGLVNGSGTLRCESADEHQQLQGTLKAALNSATMPATATILVSRKRSDAKLHVMVSPVRVSERELGPNIAVVVYVTDPERQARPSELVLQTLYGLTGAETRLALLLGDGNSLAEIAAKLNLSRNTLRSQMQSIFAKTGTSRQGQLIRLLTQLSVPLL